MLCDCHFCQCAQLLAISFITHLLFRRQEDAHEYISWLLAAADDEMRSAMTLALDSEQLAAAASGEKEAAAGAKAAVAADGDAGGEWETVGKRGGGGGVVTQVISRSR